jgi:hypothetical protein
MARAVQQRKVAREEDERLKQKAPGNNGQELCQISFALLELKQRADSASQDGQWSKELGDSDKRYCVLCS